MNTFLHANHPCQTDYCNGCETDLSRGRCHCDDAELCGSCRSYHRPSEDCPPEFSAEEMAMQKRMNAERLSRRVVRRQAA